MEGKEEMVSGVWDKVVRVKQVPNIHKNDSPDIWSFINNLTLI